MPKPLEAKGWEFNLKKCSRHTLRTCVWGQASSILRKVDFRKTAPKPPRKAIQNSLQITPRPSSAERQTPLPRARPAHSPPAVGAERTAAAPRIVPLVRVRSRLSRANGTRASVTFGYLSRRSSLMEIRSSAFLATGKMKPLEQSPVYPPMHNPVYTLRPNIY